MALGKCPPAEGRGTGGGGGGGGARALRRGCFSRVPLAFGRSSKQKVPGLISRLPPSWVGVRLGRIGFPPTGSRGPAAHGSARPATRPPWSWPLGSGSWNLAQGQGAGSPGPQQPLALAGNSRNRRLWASLAPFRLARGPPTSSPAARNEGPRGLTLGFLTHDGFQVLPLHVVCVQPLCKGQRAQVVMHIDPKGP